MRYNALLVGLAAIFSFLKIEGQTMDPCRPSIDIFNAFLNPSIIDQSKNESLDLIENSNGQIVLLALKEFRANSERQNLLFEVIAPNGVPVVSKEIEWFSDSYNFFKDTTATIHLTEITESGQLAGYGVAATIFKDNEQQTRIIIFRLDLDGCVVWMQERTVSDMAAGNEYARDILYNEFNELVVLIENTEGHTLIATINSGGSFAGSFEYISDESPLTPRKIIRVSSNPDYRSLYYMILGSFQNQISVLPLNLEFDLIGNSIRLIDVDGVLGNKDLVAGAVALPNNQIAISGHTYINEDAQRGFLLFLENTPNEVDNAFGQIQNSRFFRIGPAILEQRVTSIDLSPDNEIYTAGYSFSSINQPIAFVNKHAANGQISWSRRFHSGSDFGQMTAVVASDTGIVGLATAWDFISNKSLNIFRTDENGIICDCVAEQNYTEGTLSSNTTTTDIRQISPDWLFTFPTTNCLEPTVPISYCAQIPATGPTVSFAITDQLVSCDTSDFCTTITVEGFNKVIDFQFSLTWDTSQFAFLDAQITANGLVQGLSEFEETEVQEGRFGFGWIDQNDPQQGLSLSSNTPILEICFTPKSDVRENNLLQFADIPNEQTVNLLVEANAQFGGSDGTITIDCEKPCEANFSFVNDNECGLVTFTNLSAGEIEQYSWIFGDGATSEEVSPQHTYEAAGTYTVQLTVTDGEGCTDNYQEIITVQNDLVPPEMSCPPPVIIDCDLPNTPTNTGMAIASDNCGTEALMVTFQDEVVINNPCNSLIRRIWIATDGAGNVSRCEQLISVVDQTGPEILNCPEDITVNSEGDNCSAFVTVVAPTLREACNQVFSFNNDYTNSSNASFIYDVGTTIVTWTAIDQCGNLTICQHAITVQDISPPSIMCLTDTISVDALGEAGAKVSFDLPTPVDDCGSTVIINSPSGTFFPCGYSTVNYFAVDEAGNQSEVCSFVVAVDCGLVENCCPTSLDQTTINEAWLIVSENEKVNLQNPALRSCYTYQVDWGDGTVSNGEGYAQQNHEYQQPGSYDICFSIEGSGADERCAPMTYCEEVCVAFDTCMGQALTTIFAQSITGGGNERVQYIQKDQFGAIYVAGTFDDEMVMNNQAQNSFGYEDVFVAKYSADQKNLLWINQIGGIASEQVTALQIDNNGNLYVTGGFNSDTLHLFSHTGTGTSQQLFNNGDQCTDDAFGCNSDGFIAKYNLEGTLVWAQSLGGTETDLINDVIIFADQSYVITGQFSDIVDFDPTDDTNLAIGAIGEVFIAKYNSDGSFGWIFDIGQNSPNNSNEGIALAHNGDGAFYVTGYFKGIRVGFSEDDRFTLSSSNSGAGQDIFVAKYDTTQQIFWAYNLGNGSPILRPEVLAVSNDQLLLGFAGDGLEPLVVDPILNQELITPQTPRDIVLINYNLDFRHQWSMSLPANGIPKGLSLDTVSQSFWLSGQFSGNSIDIQGRNGSSFMVQGVGQNDVFVANYRLDGTVKDGVVIGSVANDLSGSIAVFDTNSVLVSGTFRGPELLLPGQSSERLPHTNDLDGVWSIISNSCIPPDECPSICDEIVIEAIINEADQCCYTLQLQNGIDNAWDGMVIENVGQYFKTWALISDEWDFEQQNAATITLTPIATTVTADTVDLLTFCTQPIQSDASIVWQILSDTTIVCEDTLSFTCTPSTESSCLSTSNLNLDCSSDLLTLVMDWQTTNNMRPTKINWQQSDPSYPPIAGNIEFSADDQGTVTFIFDEVPYSNQLCGYVYFTNADGGCATDTVCLDWPDCFSPICQSNLLMLNNPDSCQYELIFSESCIENRSYDLSLTLPMGMAFNNLQVSEGWRIRTISPENHSILLMPIFNGPLLCDTTTSLLTFELTSTETAPPGEMLFSWMQQERAICQFSKPIACRSNPNPACLRIEDPIIACSSDMEGQLAFNLQNRSDQVINEVRITLPSVAGNNSNTILSLPIEISPQSNQQIGPLPINFPSQTIEQCILVQGVFVDMDNQISYLCQTPETCIPISCGDCVCRTTPEVVLSTTGLPDVLINCGQTYDLLECTFDFCLLGGQPCADPGCGVETTWEVRNASNNDLLIAHAQLGPIDTCLDLSPLNGFGPGLYEIKIDSRCEGVRCPPCQFFINIPCADACQPIINCPEDVSLICPGSTTLPLPTFSDDCGNRSFSCVRDDDQPLDAPFTKAVTIVSCMVTTDLGYQDVCQYEVRVENPMVNQIICPDNLTLFTEPGAEGMVVDLPAPTFTNDCPIDWFYSIPEDRFLNCGQHSITATAVDPILQDSSFCTFEVTIDCPAVDTCGLLNVMVTVDPSTNDSCCFFVSLENNFELIQGGQLTLTLSGNDVFEQWAPVNGWQINTDPINPRTLLVNNSSNQIPTGSYTNIARICGVLYEGGPNDLAVAWTLEGGLALCAQQIPLECQPIRCCPNQSAFLNRAENSQVILSTTDCQANISIEGLGRCDEIYIDWENDGQFDVGPLFDRSAITHTYDIPGQYQVCYQIIEKNQDGTICWSPYIQCLEAMVSCEDICCKDQQLFEARLENGFTYNFQNCLLTVTPNNLNICDEVTWDWGDGNRSTAGMKGNQQSQYLFDGPGTYEVCMEVTERDDEGNGCWETEEFCQTFTVDCDPSCNCGLFERVTFGQTPISFNCTSEPTILPCPIEGQDFLLEASFACAGNCLADGITLGIYKDGNLIEEILAALNGNSLSVALNDQFFLLPGSYKIEMTGMCNTLSCICPIEFTIPDSCDCRCTPDNFFELTYDQNTIQRSCDAEPFELGCRTGSLDLGGLFTCTGDACSESLIEWTLTNPNGITISNTTSAGQFQLNISQAILSLPGNYQLSLELMCGVNTCTCELQWTQLNCEDCPCPIEDFQIGVEAMNCNQASLNLSSEFETCDQVKVDFGDGTSEIITSDTTILHYYPAPGNYTVCYYLQRNQSALDSCFIEGCLDLTVTCMDGSGQGTNLLVGGGFSEGTFPWQITNDPNVSYIEQQGCEDVNYLQFKIAPNVVDDPPGIFQEVEGIEVGATYEVSFCMATSQVFNLNSFLGTPRVAIVACVSPVAAYEDTFDNASCQLIGVSNGLQRPQDWTTIRLPDWQPDQAYAFIQVFVLNDGPYAEEITVSLDNIRISSLITSNQYTLQQQSITIIPNPFRKAFMLNFATPILHEMMVKIRNAQGQLVQQQRISVGTINHQFSMKQTEQGLYFLEVYDREGKGILIQKIIQK